MNVVPRHDVVAARRRRPAYREHQSRIKRPPQQPADLLTLGVTWQVGRATSAAVPLTRTRMMLLYASSSSTFC